MKQENEFSYFPGGVNYDLAKEQINEDGTMNVDTYDKLNKRLNRCKVWHFDGPPEKKVNAFIALIPLDSTIQLTHQRFLEALNEHLNSSSNKNNCTDQQEEILSIEFVPMSCILNSNEVEDHFIVDCRTIQSKQRILEKPLKVCFNNRTIPMELFSYDEYMEKQYHKAIKAEKYRQLLNNHRQALRRTSSTNN